MPNLEFEVSRRQVVTGMAISAGIVAIPAALHGYLGINGYKEGIRDAPRALDHFSYREVAGLVDAQQTVQLVHKLLPVYFDIPHTQIDFNEDTLLRLSAVAAKAYHAIGYVASPVSIDTVQIIDQSDQRIPSFAIARSCDALEGTDADPYHTVIFRRIKTKRDIGPTNFTTLMADVTHEVGHNQTECRLPFNNTAYLESSIEAASVFALAHLATADQSEHGPFRKSLYYLVLAHAINSLFVLNYHHGFAFDAELDELVRKYLGSDPIIDSILARVSSHRRILLSPTQLRDSTNYYEVYSHIPHGHTIHALQNPTTHRSLYTPTGNDLSTLELQNLMGIS